ncbi:MAG: Maf family protein [Patescibacteria group bacterium]
MKIILASSSSRRIKLLAKFVKDFEVKPAKIFEKVEIGKSAAKNAERLATEKARAVFEPGTLTLGCDTLGEIDEEVFGKPRGKRAAAELLRKLSGKTHAVVSSFCAKTDEREITGSAIALVKFRKLSEEEIGKYVAENPVVEFAGGYAIQNDTGKFVESVAGEIETVIGFPGNKIRKILNLFPKK